MTITMVGGGGFVRLCSIPSLHIYIRTAASGGRRGVVKRRRANHATNMLALPALLCLPGAAALAAPGKTMPAGRVPCIERLQSAVTIRGGRVVKQHL